MKKSIYIIAFLFISTVIFAQEATQQFPLSVSYYGHFAYQPGVKIGTTYTLKEWETSKKEGSAKTHQLTISPQIGFFFFRATSNNFVVNTEIGYSLQNPDNKFYSIFSIGLGYIAESLIVGYSTNIGTGSITQKYRKLNHIFMPTINYELARRLKPQQLDAFFKLSGGTKFPAGQESNLVVFSELGLKFYLK